TLPGSEWQLCGHRNGTVWRIFYHLGNQALHFGSGCQRGRWGIHTDRDAKSWRHRVRQFHLDSHGRKRGKWFKDCRRMLEIALLDLTACAVRSKTHRGALSKVPGPQQPKLTSEST